MGLILGCNLCCRTFQRDFIKDSLISRTERRGGGRDRGRETQKGILAECFCCRKPCPTQRDRVRNNTLDSLIFPTPISHQNLPLAGPMQSQLTWKSGTTVYRSQHLQFRAENGGNGGINLRAKWATSLEKEIRVCTSGPGTVPAQVDLSSAVTVLLSLGVYSSVLQFAAAPLLPSHYLPGLHSHMSWNHRILGQEETA